MPDHRKVSTSRKTLRLLITTAIDHAAIVVSRFNEPITGALIMATNMTVFMSAWMKFRGHGWRPIAEMGAAMYLPFVVLFVPMELGLITSGAMYLWGHVLMLFAMAGVMALRPAEYAHC